MLLLVAEKKLELGEEKVYKFLRILLLDGVSCFAGSEIEERISLPT